MRLNRDIAARSTDYSDEKYAMIRGRDVLLAYQTLATRCLYILRDAGGRIRTGDVTPLRGRVLNPLPVVDTRILNPLPLTGLGYSRDADDRIRTDDASYEAAPSTLCLRPLGHVRNGGNRIRTCDWPTPRVLSPFP